MLPLALKVDWILESASLYLLSCPATGPVASSTEEGQPCLAALAVVAMTAVIGSAVALAVALIIRPTSNITVTHEDTLHPTRDQDQLTEQWSTEDGSDVMSFLQLLDLEAESP